MKPFETRTELLPHQAEAVAKLITSKVGALFMDMGTGKTRTVAELVHQRRHKVDKVVYFCPVVPKATVYRELRKHTTSEDVYVFDDKTCESNLPDASWYIVGIESMSSSARVVGAVNKLITKKTYVIVDESSYIKGHKSLRTQRIIMLSEIARYRNILTGTPISQGVVDLYSQMKFLSPKILGYNSFYSFAANHLEYDDRRPGMIVRSHNEEYLAAKIKPYVYQVTKDECLELPPKMHECYSFHMGDEQSYYYQQIKNDMFDLLDAYDENYTMTSYIIFKLFTSLQQVVSGFHPQYGEFDNPRLEMLEHVVWSLPEDEKAVIFCKYAYDVDVITKTLGEDFPVAWFDGRKNTKQRQQAIDDFANGSRFLVVTQSTGGHGLNLQDYANHAIFYNNGFKYSERIQAEDRLHRIGQQSKVTYIDLFCHCGIDDRIESALRNKGDVVENFRDEVEKVKDHNQRKSLIKML